MAARPCVPAHRRYAGLSTFTADVSAGLVVMEAVCLAGLGRLAVQGPIRFTYRLRRARRGLGALERGDFAARLSARALNDLRVLIARAQPDDGTEELLRNADVAVYRAQQRGKGDTGSSEASVFSAPPDDAPLHAAATGPVGGGETILLVEDDDTVRRVLHRLLTHSGYVVLSAGCGVEALRLVTEAADSIDLVLTDVSMPGMQGPELAERIAIGHPGMPVILMSGYVGDPADWETYWHRRGKPAPVVLEKPFTGDALTQAVRAALAPARRTRGEEPS